MSIAMPKVPLCRLSRCSSSCVNLPCEPNEVRSLLGGDFCGHSRDEDLEIVVQR